MKGCASGEMLLEKILEEDSSYEDSRVGSFHGDKRHLLNGSTNYHQHSGHQGHYHHQYTGSVHVTNI
jgi:hypothetical protein